MFKVKYREIEELFSEEVFTVYAVRPTDNYGPEFLFYTERGWEWKDAKYYEPITE